MKEKPHSDAALYWVIGIVLAAMLVAGLFIYHERRGTREAKEKAAQLTQEFERLGLPVPADTGAIAAVLGTDGGAVCDAPTDPLTRALLDINLSNGAATVGMRPVIVDRLVLIGESLILKVYCPDQLPAFREYVRGKEFADVIGR